MERLTTEQQIELFKAIGITTEWDPAVRMFLAPRRGLYEALDNNGYSHIPSTSFDPTCAAYTNGIHRVTIIAAHPTVMDIGWEADYDDEY